MTQFPHRYLCGFQPPEKVLSGRRGVPGLLSDIPLFEHARFDSIHGSMINSAECEEAVGVFYGGH